MPIFIVGIVFAVALITTFVCLILNAENLNGKGCLITGGIALIVVLALGSWMISAYHQDEVIIDTVDIHNISTNSGDTIQVIYDRSLRNKRFHHTAINLTELFGYVLPEEDKIQIVGLKQCSGGINWMNPERRIYRQLKEK